MRRHVISSLTAIVFVVLTALRVYAEPLFYLSDLPVGTATPGILDRTVAPGATGQLGIYATTDIRLSNVSLGLVAVGDGIEFTGFHTENPGTVPEKRWIVVHAPNIMQDDKISSIGGFAIANVAGVGIGGASPELADPASGYLIATIDYMAVAGTAELFLQVGDDVIADWDGNAPGVVFGPGSPLSPGGNPGATDSLFDGRITVVPEPCGWVFFAGIVIGGCWRVRCRE